MSQVHPQTLRTNTNLSSRHVLIFIASENRDARRDRQAQRGNVSSGILSITLRRATGGERSSDMRRTTHTVHQQFDVGKRKLATVRQKINAQAFGNVRFVNRFLEIRSECVPLLRNVRTTAE